MSRRQRKDLTLGDRYEVVKLLEQNLTQTEISRRMGVSISQICRINSKKDAIRQEYESNSNPAIRRKRMGHHKDVEVALKTWFDEAKEKGGDTPISCIVLGEKSKDLAQALNKNEFTPTPGWLSRWKKRNHIPMKSNKKTNPSVCKVTGTVNTTSPVRIKQENNADVTVPLSLLTPASPTALWNTSTTESTDNIQIVQYGSCPNDWYLHLHGTDPDIPTVNEAFQIQSVTSTAKCDEVFTAAQSDQQMSKEPIECVNLSTMSKCGCNKGMKLFTSTPTQTQQTQFSSKHTQSKEVELSSMQTQTQQVQFTSTQTQSQQIQFSSTQTQTQQVQFISTETQSEQIQFLSTDTQTQQIQFSSTDAQTQQVPLSNAETQWQQVQFTSSQTQTPAIRSFPSKTQTMHSQYFSLLRHRHKLSGLARHQTIIPSRLRHRRIVEKEK